MKDMTSLKRALGAAAMMIAVVFAAACNSVENKSQSASLLTVQSITGKNIAGGEVPFLESDILTGDGLWTADSAKASLAVSTLDPNPIMGVSQYNDIQVTRYVVSYSRTDGKNSPGIDVPLSFEGTLSLMIRVGQSESVEFIVVREVAKQEPPLSNLIGGYMGEVINVTARVDFYGHDLANKAVKATGYLPIYFANFVNK